MARGQVMPAEQALQDGLRALPHDSGLSLQLAELYRVAAKTDQSIGIYEEILKREPGNDLAANNLASMLLDLRADRSSHERALQLVRHFESSRNPAYRDSLGWAYFRLGDYAQALPQLRKAVEHAPQAAIMQYHLGMALYRNGDLASAKPYLRKAVDAKAEFPGVDEARKILAEG
jgi:tetratricopeptide (TPR) repeat protein